MTEAGATEQPGLEMAQVEEGEKVGGDEHDGVENQPHLRDALPEQHPHLPLSVPPGGGDDVLSGRNGFVTGHTAARSSTEERLLSGSKIPEITSPSSF